MEDLIDREEKIFCPYDPAHHIMRYRMAVHLTKCRKNHPSQKLVPCEFNATHMIEEAELSWHHTICSDRKKVEPVIMQELLAHEDKYPVYNVHVPTEEMWTDIDCPTYNPQDYVEKNEILRQLDVESKSKRKNFRYAERQRIARINSEKEQKAAAAGTSGASNIVLPNAPAKPGPSASKSNVAEVLRNKIRAANVPTSDDD